MLLSSQSSTETRGQPGAAERPEIRIGHPPGKCAWDRLGANPQSPSSSLCSVYTWPSNNVNDQCL